MPEPEATPAITLDEVAHLAHLARIALTDESVASVSAVAADDIEPTSHAVPLTNVYRADEPRPCLPVEDALAAAPAVEQQRFSVPRILGEEA